MRLAFAPDDFTASVLRCWAAFMSAASFILALVLDSRAPRARRSSSPSALSFLSRIDIFARIDSTSSFDCAVSSDSVRFFSRNESRSLLVD